MHQEAVLAGFHDGVFTPAAHDPDTGLDGGAGHVRQGHQQGGHQQHGAGGAQRRAARARAALLEWTFMAWTGPMLNHLGPAPSNATV